MLKKLNLWRGLSSVFALLLVVVLFGTAVAWKFEIRINTFFGTSSTKLVETGKEAGDSIYFKSAFGELSDENLAKLIAAEDAHVQNEAGEGSVLLMNDGALPLLEGERSVSLFGHSSAYPLYKPNSGGGSRDESRVVGLKEALEDDGFTVNGQLYQAYLDEGNSRDGEGQASYGKISYNRDEAQPEFYTEAIKSTFSSFNDAAIVVLSRAGGESRDLPVADQWCTCADRGQPGHHHLMLHDDEKYMLDVVKEGNFGKRIVLLNSAYPMELDWLEEYDIDAVLWTAGPGLTGFRAISEILTGERNPSGKTVDTFAASALSAPAMMNFGNFTYTNADHIASTLVDKAEHTTHYLVYEEGIYIGYKYYETRYEDSVLGRGNAASEAGTYKSEGNWDYASEVCYPFGFGLSYTTFDQTLESVRVEGDEVIATVTVQNTGDRPGKSVVQLYAQTPYGDYERENKVEKSAVQLIGFAKTDMLDAKGGENDTQTIEVSADKYLLASYDYTNLKGYYLSEGEYYFAVGNGAHEALNNILAQKKADGASVGKLVDHNGEEVTPDCAKTVKKWHSDRDEHSFSLSVWNEEYRVTNRFDDMDVNYWAEGTTTYLSRSDWAATYPKGVTALTATDEMIAKIDGYDYVKDESKDISSYNYDVDHGITAVSMRGVPYDDPLWEQFIDQLSIDELCSVLLDQNGSAEVLSVNMRETTHGDGPDGSDNQYEYGNKGHATAYANQIVAAATWNIDLVAERGDLIAEDCLYNGVNQLWAPGANIHRTPFSGRNFEYYSEDPALSYYYAAAQTRAMKDKGLNTTIKHFVANDQETNRYGVSTFMTEQTMRETCLRAFEGALGGNNSTGVMTSFNRLGMEYSGASEALFYVLRNEWGFKGLAITDASGTISYIHTLESVVAGSDLFCMDKEVRITDLLNAIRKDVDGTILGAVRRANKNYYYAFVNSAAMNGVTSTTKLVPSMPWWKTAIIVLDAALAVGTAAFAALYAFGVLRRRKGADDTLSGRND